SFFRIAHRGRGTSPGIDVDLLDTRGHVPVAFPFGMFSERDLHEVGPDRESGIRTRQTELRAIVKTNPHCANKVRRVASKPSIPRRSSFSGEHLFQTTTTHFRGSATVDHVLHKRGH